MIAVFIAEHAEQEQAAYQVLEQEAQFYCQLREGPRLYPSSREKHIDTGYNQASKMYWYRVVVKFGGGYHATTP